MFELPARVGNPDFTALLNEIDRAGFSSLRDDAGLILMCFFAGYQDHPTRQPNPSVLLEGLNGTAKTRLARTVIDVLLGSRLRLLYDLSRLDSCARTAGSPDQSPADLVGFDQPGFDAAGKPCLVFVPGPILQNKLAHYTDELNRSPPKAQSVWLEPMAESGPVTISTLDPSHRDRRTWRLRDFWLIASQNPPEQEGTFPLPEAMADRFMVKITMRYTDRLVNMIADDDQPRAAVSPARQQQELRAALQSAEFCAALQGLEAHPDLLADVAHQEPDAREVLTAPGVAEAVNLLADAARGGRSAAVARRLEAVLLAVRRAEMRELKEQVKAVPFPRPVAEHAAGLVYDLWSRAAYAQAVGGTEAEVPIPIDPGTEALVGEDVAAGPSPRAAIALRALAKAHAWATRGRGQAATLADVEAVAPVVLRHRLLLRFQSALNRVSADGVIDRVLTYRRQNRRRQAP